MICKGLWTLHQDDDFLYCTLHNSLTAVKDAKHHHEEDSLSAKKLKSSSKLKSSLKKPSKRKLSPNATSDINADADETHASLSNIIKSYFRLDMNLQNLYSDWSRKDTHFARVCEKFPGVRMLDQPPLENVFSFICSSNNNIARISQLVEKLCVHFGEVAGTVDGKVWHAFPSVEALTKEDTEQKLRDLAFGYR